MDTPNLLEQKTSVKKPTWQQLRQILATSKTIAVVGTRPLQPHHPLV